MSTSEKSHQQAKFMKFIFNTGGSSLYCLSALSIILGLSQIMAPILNTDELLEKVLCLTALNLYEWALFGLLIFLLARQQLQTMSLYILLGIFFFSGGLLINSLASDNTNMALSIGSGAFILVLIKSFIMQRFSGFRMKPLYLLAVLVLAAWNFLMPGLCAYVFDEKGSEALPHFWRMANACFWVFQGLLILSELRNPEVNRLKKIFVAELFIVALLNQVALPYIFDFTISFSDFSISLSLLCFYLALSCKSLEWTWLTCSVPLLIYVISVGNQPFDIESNFWSMHSPLILNAMLCGLISWKKGFISLPYLSCIYSVTYSLGVYMGITNPPIVLLVVSAIASVALARLCWMKNPYALLTYGLSVIVGFLNWPGVESVINASQVPTFTISLIMIGLIIFCLNLIEWHELSLYYVSAMLIVGAILSISGQLGLTLALAGLSLSLALVAWRYLKESYLALLFTLPVIRLIYSHSPKITGWHFVILSFFLLGLGAYLNCRKQEVK